MHYREYRPSPALAGLVHRFWTVEGRAGSDEAFQPAMPDGRPELVFNLADRFDRRHGSAIERQPVALLVGPTSRPMVVRPTGRIDVIGVRLRPGAWAQLLDVRADEVRNATLELPLLAPAWRDLPAALSDTGSSASRIALLERCLAHRLSTAPRRGRPDPRVLAGVALILARGGRIAPGAVASATGLGARQLRRSFRASVGLGPGGLARVTRFQGVLRDIEHAGPVRWTVLAHRFGYCDQAHLCREFRRFGGMAPGRYLAEARELTRGLVDKGDERHPAP